MVKEKKYQRCEKCWERERDEIRKWRIRDKRDNGKKRKKKEMEGMDSVLIEIESERKIEE